MANLSQLMAKNAWIGHWVLVVQSASQPVISSE